LDPQPSTSTIHTRDGLRLTADTYLPPEPPRATAVIAHGFSASRRDPGVRAQALELQAAGLAVVVPDLRGHGDSAGACTLGHQEALDVEAAVDRARDLSDDVVVVGASMGAISVLRYAADHPELSGVVAVSGPAAWKLPLTATGLLAAAITQTRTGRAIVRRQMGVTVAPGFVRAESPVELVARIRSPLAIVHGRRDRVIPVSSAYALHAAATGPRRLSVVERMGHAFEEFGRAAVTAAAAWALGHLPGSGTAIG
jgi:pimeloyl-ACP methyl ester carboxylesterase